MARRRSAVASEPTDDPPVEEVGGVAKALKEEHLQAQSAPVDRISSAMAAEWSLKPFSWVRASNPSIISSA